MIRRIFTLISLCVTTLIITASVEAQVKESSMPELIKHKMANTGFMLTDLHI